LSGLGKSKQDAEDQLYIADFLRSSAFAPNAGVHFAPNSAFAPNAGVQAIGWKYDHDDLVALLSRYWKQFF
jgi:hypothetical protein